MTARLVAALAFALAVASNALASAFGTPGGPEPANLDAVFADLRRDPYDIELLISFGTSKGGSAGHLALAIRDDGAGDDAVWSANFYADRSPEHARGHYTDALVIRVPKKEYLYGTASSLSKEASFGLDFGEVYKRSVVAVRVRGVPAADKAALAAFFGRVNDDYRRRAPSADYHAREIRYGYLELNCAKTIGAAFRHGLGYDDVALTSSPLPPRRKVATALAANVPTAMALQLMDAWNARGYAMDVVHYRKYRGSTWVDPGEDEPVPFGELPDRFPSVLSRDFARDAGEYRDADNLYAMYLLRALARHRVSVDERTLLLRVETAERPPAYADAERRAADHASEDSRLFARGGPFRRKGTPIGDDAALAF